jgi:hypothetical protein
VVEKYDDFYLLFEIFNIIFSKKFLENKFFILKLFNICELEHLRDKLEKKKDNKCA